MKIAMICFTLTGLTTAEKIRTALMKHEESISSCAGKRNDISTDEKMEISISVKSRYLEHSISESVGKWTETQFETQDAIIFIGATGIAVRSIAPYVVSKKQDPAILVVDECGTYVISLLSGHLGGANDLAQQVAEGIGAIPVVTTATDLHGRFAVDVFAKKNNCAIFHMKAAKEASAALLAGESVGFYSEVPYEEELPEGLILCDVHGRPVENFGRREARDASFGNGEALEIGLNCEKSEEANEHGDASAPAGNAIALEEGMEKLRVGVAVTVSKELHPFEETVVVVPKILTMGIGCRKGKDAAGVKKAAEACLERGGYYKEAVATLASIDLKKEEEGILSLAREWEIPFETYSEEVLLSVPGSFTPSSFVKKITGVDNVCERSAVLSAEQGILLQRKVGADGVTTALAKKKGGLKF